MDIVPETTSYLPTIIFSLLSAFVTLLAAYYYIDTSQNIRLAKKIPGPPALPIIGNALMTLGLTPDAFLARGLEYAKQYGPVMSARCGLWVVIFLSEPKDIKIILSSTLHLDKSVEYQLFKPWLGDGLLITTGNKWHKHRKAIAPTFHMSILKSFVPLFYENSIDLVNRLCDKIGTEFDCHDYLSAVTVDILTETVMGVRKERREQTGFDYALAVKKLSDIVHRRHYDVILRPDITFQFSKFAKIQKKLLNTVHTLTNRVINEKSKDVIEKSIRDQQQKKNDKLKENTATENLSNANSTNYTKMHYVRDDLDDIDENDIDEKKRLPFLEMMIEMKRNGQMTDEEIREEVNTIMFEGHDTIAASSSFALCVLGCHSEIQARVHEELDSIFDNSDRQCTFADTVEMKYLERVILETLRIFPPVPIIARKLNMDTKIVTGDYVLPRGATVVIAQILAHRSEKYYPNPLVFDPDNFSPEKMQQRHYYAYIPFSAGPRSCVGRKYAMLKLKVLLSTILRNYRVISDKSHKDFQLRADIILKREDGFKVKVEPRK